MKNTMFKTQGQTEFFHKYFQLLDEFTFQLYRSISGLFSH